MTNPIQSYLVAAARCRQSPPCGWCLWRAGYRNPRARRYRAPKQRGQSNMSTDDTTTPAPAGYTEIRIGPEAARLAGHLKPGEVERESGAIAASWGLTAGDHDVTWWHTDAAGVPVGRARTRTLRLSLRGAWVP